MIIDDCGDCAFRGAGEVKFRNPSNDCPHRGRAVPTVRYWPFSADHSLSACWSNPMQSLGRANAQVFGQVECKRLVKWSAISQYARKVSQLYPH